MNENLNAQKVNEPLTFGERPNFGANMWGNKNFTGEDIFNSENFGAPNDFEEISDTSGADISNDFEQENNFGGFAQGGMMMFGEQRGRFNQPQRNAQQAE